MVLSRLNLYHTFLTFSNLKALQKHCGPFENIVGKGENGGDQRFLCVFSTFPKTNFNISVTSSLSAANAFNLELVKKI